MKQVPHREARSVTNMRRLACSRCPSGSVPHTSSGGQNDKTNSRTSQQTKSNYDICLNQSFSKTWHHTNWREFYWNMQHLMFGLWTVLNWNLKTRITSRYSYFLWLHQKYLKFKSISINVLFVDNGVIFVAAFIYFRGTMGTDARISISQRSV